MDRGSGWMKLIGIRDKGTSKSKSKECDNR